MPINIHLFVYINTYSKAQNSMYGLLLQNIQLMNTYSRIRLFCGNQKTTDTFIKCHIIVYLM